MIHARAPLVEHCPHLDPVQTTVMPLAKHLRPFLHTVNNFRYLWAMRIQEPARGSQRRSFSRIPTGAWIPAANATGSAPAWDTERGMVNAVPSAPRDVDIIVIGAGQAGLAMAHELQRRGLVGYVPDGEPNSNPSKPTAPSSGGSPTTETVPGSCSVKKARRNFHGTFIVLDAENRPGGAWQHRWPSLTMGSVHHIADLPGLPAGPVDPAVESADWVPSYFADFEDSFDLPILRPVFVTSVTNEEPTDDSNTTPGAVSGPSLTSSSTRRMKRKKGKARTRLLVQTTAGTYRARVVVNCTGTWTRPFIPYYPGLASFQGLQFHTQDYPGVRAFEGRRVVVVGGGISALSHLDDLDGVAKKLLWVTRTPPRWHGKFPRDVDSSGAGCKATPGGHAKSGTSVHAIAPAERGESERGLTVEFGREVEERVRERVEKGLKPLPVVAATGLPINDFTRSLHARGLLRRRPMFNLIQPDGVSWTDGRFWQADAIVWATGFRAELRHLMPLGLRARGGGIVMKGTRVAADPRIHLIGYGPSASTVGARWASRQAAREIIEYFRS